MINFTPITTQNKELYESFLFRDSERGCEFSFANVVLWGNQNFALVGENLAMLSHFGEYTVYPFPFGENVDKNVLDMIVAHAKENGNPVRFSGISPNKKERLEQLYPGKFSFSASRNSFDYVYDIDDLADLPGRKYHSKRNHIKRFENAFPDYKIISLNCENIHLASEISNRWFAQKSEENPENNFEMERIALSRAFDNFEAFELEGIVLTDGINPVAFTIASRLSADTFDVHFEKALRGVDGAYAVVNREFARALREKFPEVRFVDREEDMGIEGLRKAKLSYYPHHLVEKYRATLLAEEQTV